MLRKTAKAVPKKDIGSPALKKVIAKMRKVLAGEGYGVAIAAPQIGESLRIFVVAGKAFVTDEEKKAFDNNEPGQPVPPDMVFINPELARLSRAKKEMSEGCLSVRGKYGTVMRHLKASVKALDERGKPTTYHGSGLIAHIFQHECDHLDGILYTDKAVLLEEDEDMKGAREKLNKKRGI